MYSSRFGPGLEDSKNCLGLERQGFRLFVVSIGLERQSLGLDKKVLVTALIFYTINIARARRKKFSKPE